MNDEDFLGSDIEGEEGDNVRPGAQRRSISTEVRLYDDNSQRCRKLVV